MSLQTKKYITPEEYLAAERAAEFKSEYYQGEVFALAGAGSNHNIITANLMGLLYSLKKKNCQVFPSDMRVHIPVNGLYTYPDVSVTCGERQFLDSKKDTLLNPIILVEVLSPSTADYDRGKKFMLYRSIPTLQHYILIDSQTCHIEKYSKNETGNWVLSETRDTNAILTLENLEVPLAVAHIYEDAEIIG
jgi:Uma2 family endonuclease